MASLLSPRRTEPDLELHATVARSEEARQRPDEAPLPRYGWLVMAVGGGLTAALSGWVLLAGVAVLGWLAADRGSLVGAIGVGTQLWLLANGAGAQLGSTAVTLVPWGATLVFAVILSRAAGFAARHAPEESWRSAAGVTGATTVAYVVPVLLVSVFAGGAPHPVRGLAVSALVAVAAAGWGSCRALGCDLTAGWPAWARAVPRAVAGAQLTLLAAGAAALATGLVVHVDRVVALSESLDAGVVGGIALLLAQLAFVPNAVVWSASYALGAGFTLGQGSVVAPASTQLGLLPSVPLLGALPGSGAGEPVQLWWLAAGALAGAVAAWLVTRARPAARLDETCLVGGLSGVTAGLVFVVLAWATSGDLGAARLAGLGPRLLPLLVMAATTLGLAGMLVGLVVGLLRRHAAADGPGRVWRRRPREEATEDVPRWETLDADEEETAVIAERRVQPAPPRRPE
jgi:hypothetical protein